MRDMNVLTMKDLAERWGKSYTTIRVWRSRGKLPPPDLDLPHSPAWYEDTITKLEGNNGIGRTDRTS